MRCVLHIFTQPNQTLGRQLAECQARESDLQVEWIDLTQGSPDYDCLLDQIFEADSVEVW